MVLQLRGVTIWVVLLIHRFWWALSMAVLFTVIFFLTHVLLRGTCKAKTQRANWVSPGTPKGCSYLSYLFFSILNKENSVYNWRSEQAVYVQSSCKDVTFIRKRKWICICQKSCLKLKLHNGQYHILNPLTSVAIGMATFHLLIVVIRKHKHVFHAQENSQD